MRFLAITLGLLILAGCAHTKSNSPAPNESVKLAVTLQGIRLTMPERAYELVVPKEEFVPWIREFTEAFRAVLEESALTTAVMVEVDARATGPAQLHVEAKDDLSPSRRAGFSELLARLPPPTPRFGRYRVQLLAGHDAGVRELFDVQASDLARRELEAASLAEKRALISQWARQEAIPLLTTLFAGVGDEDSGVHRFGAALQKASSLDYESLLSLTDKSGAFWRASLETLADSQFVPLARMLLWTSAERFDLPLRLVPAWAAIIPEERLDGWLFSELRWRLQVLNRSLQPTIDRGRELHGAGRYDEAIALYDEVLRAYPNSAAAMYERWFSGTMKQGGGKNALASWSTVRTAVYERDPLFPVEVHASGKAAIHAAFQRLRLMDILRKNAGTLLSHVQALAEVTVDIEEYGLAADAFLLSGLLGEKEAAYGFLYCIEKLGHPDVAQFEKRPPQIDAIEDARRQRFEKSPGRDP